MLPIIDYIQFLCAAISLGAELDSLNNPPSLPPPVVHHTKTQYGIGAHPNTATAELIALLAHKYKPKYIETKTFRDTPVSVPTRPIVYFDHRHPLHWQDLEHSLYASYTPPESGKPINIANSTGMPSPDCQTTKIIINKTMDLLKQYAPKTKLIFSVHGSSVDGFQCMARLAKDLNVPYVCANLACPNIEQNTGMLYKDTPRVLEIVSAMHAELGSIPLIIKIGAFRPNEQNTMEDCILHIARGGAYAVYGINALQARVIDKDGLPAFGVGREYCGLSGPHIHDIALEWIEGTRKIIQKHGLPLKIFASGGASTPQNFQNFFDRGADAVFSTTAVMLDPSFKFPNAAEIPVKTSHNPIKQMSKL